MRRLVLIHQHEWLVGVTLFLKPTQRQIGDDIRCITFMFNGLGIAVQKHRRVVIRPLADQHFRLVVALGRRHKMPFSNNGRLIADLLQKLWKRLLGSVEFVVVGAKTVDVTVLSRLNDGSAGTADSIGTETIGEQHAFVRDAIKIRSRVDF